MDAEQLKALTDDKLRELLVRVVAEGGERSRARAQDAWDDHTRKLDAVRLQGQRRSPTPENQQ